MHKSLEVHGHGNQEEFKWSTMIDSEEDDDGDDDYNNHPALKRSPSACRLKKRVAVAVIVEKAAPGGHGTPNENSDGPPASNALGDLYAGELYSYFIVRCVMGGDCTTCLIEYKLTSPET